jgi:hypothetical protein
MRKPILPAAVIAVALLTCTVASAQTAQWMTNPNAGTDVVVKDNIDPLAPLSITQSTDPYTIADGTSIACVGAVTTENAWLRLFDLDGDHGLVDTFTVDSVDWATQSAGGTVELTLNVYCLVEGLPFLYQFLTLKDSAAVTVVDEFLTFHSAAVGGSCDTATEDMAVEIFAEDCNIVGCETYFVGMNQLGETGYTYLASASCGVDEPVWLYALTGEIAHLIMVVNGQDEMPPDDGGGGDVPATTKVGAIFLLLILLGSGAYFLRRRAAT